MEALFSVFVPLDADSDEENPYYQSMGDDDGDIVMKED